MADLDILNSIDSFMQSETVSDARNSLGLGGIYREYSTGLIGGAILTVNGGGNSTLDMAAGAGDIIDATTNPLNPTRISLSWSAFSAVVLTNIGTELFTEIFVNASAQIVQTHESPTPAQRRDLIYIGKVIHSNFTTINAIITQPEFTTTPGNIMNDFFNEIGLINIKGNKITASPAGNLKFDKSVGKVFKPGINYEVDVKDPNSRIAAAQTDTVFRYRSLDGSNSASLTDVDPTLWDNNGVLTPLVNNNRASNQYVFMFPNGLVVIQHGQTEYSTFNDAVAAALSEPLEREVNIEDNGVLIAVICMTKGATDLTDLSTTLIKNVGRFGVVNF